MNNFGFRAPTGIRDYEWLRLVALWAGGLGVAQALVWIGLCITGILSYNCAVSVEPASYGSIVGLIFVQLYFRGDCLPNGMLGYNFTMLESVQTVLDREQILIWTSVYLFVAACWLISSYLIITQIDKQQLNLTAGLIITWICITCGILIMDTALGIIFSLDYGRFHIRAYDYNYSSMLAGAIEPEANQLTVAYIVALLMVLISFKFFFLWLADFVLMLYLLVLVKRMLRECDNNDTLFMTRKDSVDVLDRPPINAFDEQKSIGYINDSFITESIETVELNQEAIIRAARMSNDVTNQDRRFRNLDAYQQYPPLRTNPNAPNNNNNNASNNMNNNSMNMNNNLAGKVNANQDLQFPAPDYTPPMSRAYQRYQ